MSDFMPDHNLREQDFTLNQKKTLTLKSRKVFSNILTFGLVLTLESLIILTLQLELANVLNTDVIYINLGSLFISIAGAITFTYYYYTRFKRRILILRLDNFSLQFGKEVFEYSWKDFSLVALATASATYGAKGYIIRLYENDLDGDYVDLPLYRFPKVDTFEMRDLVEERVLKARKSSTSSKK